jgi:hypothetical protein
MKKKKYVIFGFNNFYPRGGMNDLILSVDTLEEVEEFIKKDGNDFCQVVDRDTFEIIREIL